MWIVLIVAVLFVLHALLQGWIFWRMVKLSRRHDQLIAEYDLLADHYRLLVGFGTTMVADVPLVPEPQPPSRLN